MIKRCKNCNNEFESKRIDAMFCSDKCRKFFKRHVRDNSDVSEKQRMLDLESKSLAELKAEGYWIPNWKRSGYKNRKEALNNLWDIIPQYNCIWMFQDYFINTTSNRERKS